MKTLLALVSGVFASCALAPNPASAAVYSVAGSGVVSSINAIDGGQGVAPPPSSAVAVGDAVTFSFSFDAGAAQLQSLFDDDPTINIYYLPVTDFFATIGGYAYHNDPGYIGNASLQLWNDYVVYPGAVDDAQSFSFNGRGPDQAPFDLGSGPLLESFSIDAFDPSALARSSDLISEIVPYASFSSRPFSYLEASSDGDRAVDVGGTFTGTITEVAAVPEPCMWALMVAGFGLMGGRLRSRRRSLLTGHEGLV